MQPTRGILNKQNKMRKLVVSAWMSLDGVFDADIEMTNHLTTCRSQGAKHSLKSEHIQFQIRTV
jgi:hypothetical protein